MNYYNLLKIKDNGIDKVNGGIVVYMTLHEIPPFALDMPLDFIFIRGDLDIYPQSNSDARRDASLFAC